MIKYRQMLILEGEKMFFSSPFDNAHPREYRIPTIELFNDLNAVEVGYNRVPPGLYQSLLREEYILHYVVRGSGVFCGEAFKSGDSYIVHPNMAETIVSDSFDPYETYWFKFKGTHAGDFVKKCGMPNHNGVFHFDKTKECAEILKNALYIDSLANEYEEAEILNAAMHHIMSHHFTNLKTISRSNSIAAQVMNFLNKNYTSDISIDAIANNLNYHRSYLYMLFKSEYGISPKEYIVDLRIKRAKELLLENNQLSIGEISMMVGYQDQLYFARLFHQKAGCSPRDFVKANKTK